MPLKFRVMLRDETISFEFTPPQALRSCSGLGLHGTWRGLAASRRCAIRVSYRKRSRCVASMHASKCVSFICTRFVGR